MPVNTLTVASAVTPKVIETYLSHYFNRKPLREKPTAHISYHEGLELIRRFLHYASFHTVDELQAFTSQWVPVPTWVHSKEVDIPAGQLARSAEYIQAQLGPHGVEATGGMTWWQWRRDNKGLKAEWIEMRKDYMERKKLGTATGSAKGQRIMLYVHGGAYYFGSVDEHRYQMQRHARKLKARVLAPRYRLAPQFPFPCGLQDCLATYLFLLEEKHDPSTIILAGDSAGGGMVLSVLALLRDQGIPLPAGAILISPWVDLTHSFPSLNGDGKMDYIPAHGFVHKPSMSWPPPNADDLLKFERNPQQLRKAQEPSVDSPQSKKEVHEDQKEEKKDRVRGFSLTDKDRGIEKPSDGQRGDVFVSADGKYSIGPKSILSVQLDGGRIEIKDQIQMYAANHLLTHPLVSPALQPTLGGLPPLLILTGGGELLHDEQVYIAHKAAQPLAYLPPPSNHQTAESIQAQAVRYRPTNVQLQVWDDLCHVAPTLSFTRPAKHMYRSIAQFGAWALARAQQTTIDIMDDDSISIVSKDSSDSSASTVTDNPSPEDIKLSMPQSAQHVGFKPLDQVEYSRNQVGKAGDPLPAFEHHMIRQRIDRHGHIHPLSAKEDLVALKMETSDIGVPKPGPIKKWMKAQEQWNGKYAKQKLKIQRQRVKDMEKGYEGFDGETPPPTALAGRRVKGMKAEKAKKKSWGMAMWSLWGSKHDEVTIERQEQADKAPEQEAPTSTTEPTDGTSDDLAKPAIVSSKKTTQPRNRGGLGPGAKSKSRSRSRSRVSTVTDKGQIQNSVEDLTNLAHPIPGFAEATKTAPDRRASPLPSPSSELSSLGAAPITPNIVVEDLSRPQSPPDTVIPPTDTSTTRPFRGGIAYPFSLKVDEAGREVNASTVTLQSINCKGGEGISAVVTSDEEVSRGNEGQEHTEDSALVNPSGVSESKANGNEKDGLERPGVERFVTASEDLTTLANKEKA